MTGAVPQAIKKLSKFLDYVLGRHPDEFGLLPDASGYVKIKTLLQALHEDPQWRHLRQAHLHSLTILQQPGLIEIQGDLIRARDRVHLPAPVTPSEWPKLLFAPVRRRAYPVVLREGLRPAAAPFILLSTDKAVAERLGRRMDNTPVLVTVQVALSRSAGAQIRKYGDCLYLADFIPAQTISGPPLPKAKPVLAQSKPLPLEQPSTPGSFFPDPASFQNPEGRRQHKRSQDWKQDRRRARKEKERRWK